MSLQFLRPRTVAADCASCHHSGPNGYACGAGGPELEHVLGGWKVDGWLKAFLCVKFRCVKTGLEHRAAAAG